MKLGIEMPTESKNIKFENIKVYDSSAGICFRKPILSCVKRFIRKQKYGI